MPHVDWETSEKYYDADQVRTMVEAIEACQPRESGRDSGRVGVRSAAERGDYHFGYMPGRSVTMFSADG